MKGETITIAGREIAIAFNYGSFRWLARKWKMKYVNDVFIKLDQLLQTLDEKTGMSLDQEDIIIDLILSGVNDPEVDEDFLITNDILLNPDLLKQIFGLFMDAMVQFKKGEQPAPQTTKKKVKKK